MIDYLLIGKIMALGAVMLVMAEPALARSARIDSSTGRVLLKREDWSDFYPVAAGTKLNQGDLIKPDIGVKVIVVCPDLSKRRAIAGVPSGMKIICPIWKALIAKAPSAPGTLGGTDQKIPYLITPRHTLLLSNTPTFRWNKVSNATQYEIKLLDPTGVIWQQQVKEATVIYTGNPPLKPGISYSLVIQASTGSSSQSEVTSNLDFIILRKSELKLVESEVSKITKIALSKQANALMLANFYSSYTLPQKAIKAYGLTARTSKSYNLSAKAIATLLDFIKQGEASPVIYRTLGDVYWQTGLANLAAQYYWKAIEQVKTREDLEQWTLAHFSLGEVYAATDNSDWALRSYNQARFGYILLGDTQRADLLEQQIESLKIVD